MTYLSVIRQAFHFVPPTESVLDRSLSLSARYSLSHWDSLLLAACAEAGVTTLYSEDLSDGQTYGPVAVVNPFR
jgi:predicted nucleic acid-binding protein